MDLVSTKLRSKWGGEEEYETGVGDSFQKSKFGGKNQDNSKKERLDLEKDSFAFVWLEDGRDMNIFICRRRANRSGKFEELEKQILKAYEKGWNLQPGTRLWDFEYQLPKID